METNESPNWGSLRNQGELTLLCFHTSLLKVAPVYGCPPGIEQAGRGSCADAKSRWTPRSGDVQSAGGPYQNKYRISYQSIYRMYQDIISEHHIRISTGYHLGISPGYHIRISPDIISGYLQNVSGYIRISFQRIISGSGLLGTP